MTDYDKPIDTVTQIILMKKYVVFTKKAKIERMLRYAGYFRLSRYGKFLISYSNVFKSKPNQKLLFAIYDFDVELRNLFFNYCKKAEIQFKSHLSNAISLSENNSTFYLDRQFYTESKGEKNKSKKLSNIYYFKNKFFDSLTDDEMKLRQNVNKYPELKDYRTGGQRSTNKIPCWVAFAYFEFGTVTQMYSYLRGDLRKKVLVYGYSKSQYGKEITKQMDTWLDAVRNLRNVCAHHNKLVGKTSSVVLNSYDDKNLENNTNLFSRLYALKKILCEEDGIRLKADLCKVISKSKIDIYQLNILPENWETLYDSIKLL